MLNKIKYIYNLLNSNNNVIIGGSYSLLLHGLITHEKPNDIDLIIYSPTHEQKKYLEFLSLMTISTPKKTEYERRSYKIKIDDILVDILVSEEKLPDNLLSITKYDTTFKIQDIKGVFKARQAYNKVKIRRKDVIASSKLKELNFNIF